MQSIIPYGKLKTSWERSEGQHVCYAHINAVEVVVGEHYGSGHTDNAGTCTWNEFLSGTYNDVVKSNLGEDALIEILEALKSAHRYEPFINKQQQYSRQIQYIQSIPEDPSIETLIKDKNFENGYMNYGNAGGYNSRLETDSYNFFIDASDFKMIVLTIFNNQTKNKIDVILPGLCSGMVFCNNLLYMTIQDQAVVVNTAGEIIFNSETLKDSKGEPWFGSEIRIAGVIRKNDVALFSCRFFSGIHDGCYLKFDSEKKVFSRRWCS